MPAEARVGFGRTATGRTGDVQGLSALFTEPGVIFIGIVAGEADHGSFRGMHLRPIIDLSGGEDKRRRAREGETGAMDYAIMCVMLYRPEPM